MYLLINPVANPGRAAEGAMATSGPVKIVIKKMAAKDGHIDFMFLGPPPPYWLLDPQVRIQDLVKGGPSF